MEPSSTTCSPGTSGDFIGCGGSCCPRCYEPWPPSTTRRRRGWPASTRPKPPRRAGHGSASRRPCTAKAGSHWPPGSAASPGRPRGKGHHQGPSLRGPPNPGRQGPARPRPAPGSPLDSWHRFTTLALAALAVVAICTADARTDVPHQAADPAMARVYHRVARGAVTDPDVSTNRPPPRPAGPAELGQPCRARPHVLRQTLLGGGDRGGAGGAVTKASSIRRTPADSAP